MTPTTHYYETEDGQWDDPKVKVILKTLMHDYGNMLNAIYPHIQKLGDKDYVLGVMGEFSDIMQDPLGELLRTCEHCDVFGFANDDDINEWALHEDVAICPDCFNKYDLPPKESSSIVEEMEEILGGLRRYERAGVNMHPTTSHGGKISTPCEYRHVVEKMRNLVEKHKTKNGA